MRYNGLQLVIGMALRRLESPLAHRFEDALVLGAIGEDVVYDARRRRIREHWSLTHFSGGWLPGGFVPFLTRGAADRAQFFFDRAVAELARRRIASAFVQLGHASHLLIDMACPVHAHRVAHWSDPYEWYVEGHCAELAALPVAAAPRRATVAATVAALARQTRCHPADRTHHHWGHALKRLGMRQSLSEADVAAQAAALIPLAAGHLAAVYRMFLESAAEPPRPDRQDARAC